MAQKLVFFFFFFLRFLHEGGMKRNPIHAAVTHSSNVKNNNKNVDVNENVDVNKNNINNKGQSW